MKDGGVWCYGGGGSGPQMLKKLDKESLVAIDIDAWYRRYGPMVYRRCLQLLGDEEMAHGAMQDVFVQVLRKKESLDERAPSSLLYRIATNLCLNIIRSKKRKPATPMGELVENLSYAGAEQDRRAWHRQALSKILGQTPESTATIAVLHYVDGMTLEEVANEVSMSVSGVRKRLRQLRGVAEAFQREALSHG